jgi:CRISPR/Cas system CMR-associated protein Cmr3 (group 5 of RAMP superfamily)
MDKPLLASEGERYLIICHAPWDGALVSGATENGTDIMVSHSRRRRLGGERRKSAASNPEDI